MFPKRFLKLRKNDMNYEVWGPLLKGAQARVSPRPYVMIALLTAPKSFFRAPWLKTTDPIAKETFHCFEFVDNVVENNCCFIFLDGVTPKESDEDQCQCHSMKYGKVNVK